MALTRITKGVIKPNENYDTHNINSTGIITATKFVGPLDAGVSGTNSNFTGIVTAATFKGNIVGTAATFTGPVTIGGTLTYEDVTNIDSVGLVTARAGVKIPDSQSLILGSDDDAELKHTGSNLVIRNTTGNIRIEPKNGQLAIQSQADERTSIYFSGTKKFETTNTGAVVSGILTATEYRGGGSIGIKIKSNGNVGIGTDDPTSTTLHVSGTSQVTTGIGNTIFKVTSTSFQLFNCKSTSGWSNMTHATSPLIKTGWLNGLGDHLYLSSGGNTPESGQMVLLVSDGHGVKVGKSAWDGSNNTDLAAGTEYFRIKTDGKTGIGTDEPFSNLTVYGENRSGGGSVTGQITAKDNAAWNASPTCGIIFQGHYHSNNANAIFGGITGFKENGTEGNYAGALAFHSRADGEVSKERLRIKSDGKVGVNTTTPTQQFTSYAASGYPILANGTSNGIGLGGNGAIVFGTKDLGSYAKGILDATELEVKISGSPKVYLHSNSHISIGVDNDSYEFTLQGSGGGAPTLWLRDGTTSGLPRILFGDTNGAAVGVIEYNNNGDYMQFKTGGNPLFQLTNHGSSAGRVVVKSGGVLLVGLDSPSYGSGDMKHEIKKNNSRVYTAPLMVAHSHLLLNNSDTTAGNFVGIGMRTGTGDGAVGFVYTGTANHSDFVICTDSGVNGAEKLRIKSNSGYIGINTTNPQRYIHIVGNDGPSGATPGNSDSTMCLDNAGTNGAMIEFLNANNGAGHIMFTDTDGANTGRISYHHDGDYFRMDAGGLASRVLLYGTGATIFKSNSASHIILDRAADNAYIRFRSNSVDDAATIQCSESSGGAFLTLKTKNTDGNLRNRFDITNNGNTYTAEYGGNNRTYPIIGGAAIGSSGAEAGQVNWHDIQSPQGTVGGWVLLGLDYNGAHPWPARAYKIAQHENGVNCTRVYQLWHDGDANYDYGGLWEVRLNEWGSSSNRFESVSFRCVNGKRDDMKLLCYNDTNGVWVQPNTIWGQIYIRRSGWDNSGRIRGSSYCAVANNGALAFGDTAGANGTIPSGSGKFELYPFDGNGGSHTGGRDIENSNNFEG